MDPLIKLLYCSILSKKGSSKIQAYAKYTNIDDKRALSCAKEKFYLYNDNAGKLLLEYILNKEEYIDSAYKKLKIIAKQHNLKEVKREVKR